MSLSADRCQFGQLALDTARTATIAADEALERRDYEKNTKLTVVAERLQALCRACKLCDTAGYRYPPAVVGAAQSECGLTEAQITKLGGVATGAVRPGNTLSAPPTIIPAIIEVSIPPLTDPLPIVSQASRQTVAELNP